MNRIFVLTFVLGVKWIEALPLQSDEIIDLSSLGSDLYGTPDQEETAILVDNYSEDEDAVNPEELGNYLEGDILLPRTRQFARNGRPEMSSRWHQGIVPYVIKGTFDKQQIDAIHEAMEEYHEYTCIRFVRRIDEPDYIVIGNQKSGCWSSLGRLGGRQRINLQTPSCLRKVGTVIHELMHSLGFMHEQTREERDDYVQINKENIRTKYLKNFRKANKTMSFGVEYDYGSIMHYSRKAFSSNGLPTMTAIKKLKGVRMGQRWGFSQSDVLKVNRMYNCSIEENLETLLPEIDSAEETSEETTEETNENTKEEMIDPTDTNALMKATDVNNLYILL
ncbi:hypothetical protein ACLKA7_011503 [Drosophila subpalustris]